LQALFRSRIIVDKSVEDVVPYFVLMQWSVPPSSPVRVQILENEPLLLVYVRSHGDSKLNIWFTFNFSEGLPHLLLTLTLVWVE